MEDEFNDFVAMLDHIEERNRSVHQSLYSDTMKGLEEF